jgi:hypothetical protein
MINIKAFAKAEKNPSAINLSLKALKISLTNSYVAFSVVRFFPNPNCSLTNMF